VVFSGPSGVGKDTVLQKMRDLGLPMHYAITATTRPRRPGEIDGFHYYFLSEQEFLRKKEQDELLECARVYGHWYGPPKEPIREALARGQDVMLKIDVQGARSVREQAPDALFLFLAPPSLQWLRHHLRARKTETPEKLRERERAAMAELAAANEFDHIIVNQDNDVAEVVREITHILAQARQDQRGVRL
jgi:guanylate kinase